MEDSILSKLLYYQGNQQIANQQGNQYIPYQITNGIFHRITTEKFTICMETQKTLNNQSNLEKERAGAIRLLEFGLYWHKNRNIDQWNRIKIRDKTMRP